MSETLGRFIDRNLARSLIHAGPKPSSFGGCGLIDSRDATVRGTRVTGSCTRGWGRRGKPQVPQQSRGDGSICCVTPAGMKKNRRK